MKQNRLYACEICNFDSEENKQNNHDNLFEHESDIEDSDDDICPTLWLVHLQCQVPWKCGLSLQRSSQHQNELGGGISSV